MVYSGVLLFVLSAADYYAFASATRGSAKQLMQGRATVETERQGELHFRSVGVGQNQVWLGLAPSVIALMIARLRWWQTIARAPQRHEHYFTAFLFGG